MWIESAWTEVVDGVEVLVSGDPKYPTEWNVLSGPYRLVLALGDAEKKREFLRLLIKAYGTPL